MLLMILHVVDLLNSQRLQVGYNVFRALSAKCAVPENIHSDTPFTEGFCFAPHSHLEFQFSFILS